MFEGTTTQAPAAATHAPEPQAPKRRILGLPAWLVTVVGIVLVGAIGFGLGTLTRDDSESDSASSSSPTPTLPTLPVPTTPEAKVLAGLIVGQRDVDATTTIVLIPNGDRVTGATTLDLCNGTFPSESLRTDRLQVAAVDVQGSVPLSTEAVLYTTPAATAQAFGEIKAVAASCPSTPVVSPVGGSTVITRFGAAPDGDWPQNPTVERLAYRMTTTGQSGVSNESIAVYLRRGRVLMGIYFPDPEGAQPAVEGKTTVAGIVSEFAGRIAELPEATVNG